MAIGISDLQTVFRHFRHVVVPRGVLTIRADLASVLDAGESAVIQTALDSGIGRVCIDETLGRRVARLNGLAVTGSLGMIIHAIRCGENIELSAVIGRMRENGIWLSDELAERALRLVDK